MAETLRGTFQNKYLEFCEDLKGAVPELIDQIDEAKYLPVDERITRFVKEVLTNCSPTRDATACPGTVLPGVILTEKIWSELSENTRQKIQEYLTILSMCTLFDGAKENMNFGEGKDAKSWADDFMNTWQSKLSSIDFEGIAKKLADAFKTKEGAFTGLPERFLKGHLAKLIEELVRDFKPEDFGLDPELVKSMEDSPTRAFELIMELYQKKPQFLQNAIAKITNRLQAKFRSGELRPEQIASEAEELMKDFTSNPAVTELMESIRSMFGMEDMDIARKAGREENARSALVRDRLRKKLEAKKTGAASKK